MHFLHLATLTGLILCTFPSALASPTPNPIPIDSSLLTPEVQKNVYEYISAESSPTASSELLPSSTPAATSSAPESLSMMQPWSAGILAAAGLFASLL